MRPSPLATRPSGVSVAPDTVPEQSAPARRDPFLDNAKFLAILLVVAGHAIEELRDVRAAHVVYLFVYVFHMPVFILVTGYLSRNSSFSGGKARKLVTAVGVPYVIFQVLYSVLAWRLHGDPIGAPLTPYWLMWFLAALFLWRLSVPVWQQLRWPVAVAVALSLLGGVTDLGNTLALNRVLGFLPFFVAGLFLKPDHLELLKRPVTRVLGAAALLGGVTVAYFADRHMATGWIFRNNGNAYFHVDDLTGTLMRVGLLLGSAVLTAAFLAIVPARRMWFTSLGAATLYAYLLHGFAIRVAQYLGLYRNAWLHTPEGVAATAAGAAVLAALLCLPPVRFLTHWVIEPNMNWAFTPASRPRTRPYVGRRRSA